MEAAGVEPASANRSFEASTCVLPCRVRFRARPEHGRPGLATYCLVPDEAAPPEDQPDFSTSQESPRAGSSRNGLRLRPKPYAASARLSLAIVNFPVDLRGPGTSARNSDLTKHVDTVTPPLALRRMKPNDGFQRQRFHTAEAAKCSCSASLSSHWP